MVLPASQAQFFTTVATSNNADENLAREVQLTEAAIRTAAGQEREKIVYNARIVGNPAGDPFDDALLDDLQEDYRDSWVNAGYQVSRDEDTGYWVLSWQALGPEELVTIYSVRTNVTPGPVQNATISQIELFFSTVTPAVTAKASIVPINGGDIDENDFGATSSVFYEYLVLVTQPTSFNHASNLKTNLKANITAYNPPNVIEVYKLN